MTLWKGFQKPKRLEVENETLSGTYGKFYAQPFERGFGTTVGNALRRVLLSSIEGAAITSNAPPAGDGSRTKKSRLIRCWPSNDSSRPKWQPPKPLRTSYSR